MILAIFVVVYIAVGFALCYFILWLQGKFNLIEYSIDHSHDSKRMGSTNAQGEDADPENEDVRGSIGFIGGEQ